MSKVLKFLQDSKVFFLATSDGDQARVRPLGFVMEYEGKISFCTSNTKSMSKQLKANPKAEHSAVAGYHQTTRIACKAAVTSSKAAKEKVREVA
uniref:pyridoxamine 5'-phosphate oxidase family protein n=1 Tax=Treponema endosymbiont of Eucomonympha sp. TaxID=1580831 RepID=UPI0007515972